MAFSCFWTWIHIVLISGGRNVFLNLTSEEKPMIWSKFYAKFYGELLKKMFWIKLTFQNKLKKFIGYHFHQLKNIFTEDNILTVQKRLLPKFENSQIKVRFMSYSKCFNFRQILKLSSNFGCLFTFCYLDGANSIKTDLHVCNLWTGQFVSYKSVI